MESKQMELQRAPYLKNLKRKSDMDKFIRRRNEVAKLTQEFKIEVVHDESGDVVRRLGYSSERDRDKAYNGLIKKMNLDEYTANLINEQDT